MQINKLDHVNVRTVQLDVMIDWYGKILGMHSGDRPNFPFAGAWMYAGDQPAVHLVSIENNDAVGSEVELKLEHFAFSAKGLYQFEEKLRLLDIPFRRSELLEINIVQINVWDPDGNHIHVDFDANE